jgi:hypothetical protein
MGTYHLSKGTLELCLKKSNIDICYDLTKPTRQYISREEKGF